MNRPCLGNSDRFRSFLTLTGFIWMLTYTISTLGCKVNQYESSAIDTSLRQLGFAAAAPGAAPDLVVLNTCCITTTAMGKSRQALRRLARSAPGAAFFVTGCYGDYDPQRLRGILAGAGVDPERLSVAGHHRDAHRHLLEVARGLLDAPRHAPLREAAPVATSPEQPGLGGMDDRMKAEGGTAAWQAGTSGCSTLIKGNRIRAVKAGAPGTAGFGPIDRFGGHQRAFVKVQDGCDAFCSYCVVPFTRPRVWSRPRDVLLAECRSLVDSGHREIVLCGVFLGAYGRDTTRRDRWSGPSPLPGLLREIATLDGLWRVRLSSLEPGDVTDELLDVYASNAAAAPHLHLPLQSGSDAILGRMNRQYTRRQFLDAARRIAARLDRPALSADVIVGFPGESEADFEETLDACRQAGFCKIHAFPFSPIAPAAAWQWRRERPDAVAVRDRMARLAALEAEMAEAYRRQFVGQTVEVLVEGRDATDRRDGTRHGLTDRYLTDRFAAPAGDDTTGRVVVARVEAVTNEGLSATLG